MIIFGWGRRTRTDFGRTVPVKCSKCNNNAYWNLVRMRTWFTLFFVPVIPYENQHILLCEICSNGVVLPSDSIDRAKQLNADTARYLRQEITQEEYSACIDRSNILS